MQALTFEFRGLKSKLEIYNMSFEYFISTISTQLVKNFHVSVRYHFDLEILIWVFINRS